MAFTDKTIRSRRDRQQAAVRLIEKNGWDVARRDRDAVVKYLLLEDILRVFRARLDNCQSRLEKGNYLGESGKVALTRAIQKYEALTSLYGMLVDIATTAIIDGNFKLVNKSINERTLIASCDDPSQLYKMKDLAKDLLFELSTDLMTVTREMKHMLPDLDAKDDTADETEGTLSGIIAQADRAFANDDAD